MTAYDPTGSSQLGCQKERATPPSFPIARNNGERMMRTFTDDQRQLHALDLDAVLIDGQHCLSVQATEQSVQFETVQGVAITCELGQFWREVAGPDLSAQGAGLLLAEYLIRQIVLQRTSSALQEAMALLTKATALSAEIPSSTWLTTRLDPLSKQAMRAYDGTPEMTDMLARILQREPATIHHWACQLGLETPAPDILVEIEPESVQETLAEAEARERFFWNAERIQQLEQALAHCTASTVAERARQIAAEHGWPEASVRSKLYAWQQAERSSGNGGRPTRSSPAVRTQRQKAKMGSKQRNRPCSWSGRAQRNQVCSVESRSKPWRTRSGWGVRSARQRCSVW